ncbi:MAG: PAS domain S-box protein [Methylococcales bacterium]|nr:PAS domain S-box protein [Methylococcales bacterium]
MSTIIRDVSARKQKEDQLALLDYAFDHVDEAIYLIDENARFFQVNEKACRSLGYTREELLTMQIFDIDPDFKPEHWEHFRDGITEGSLSVTMETRHQTKEGRIFPVEISANHIFYQGRHYDMAMVRDISERKTTERQLALLNYALVHVGETVCLIDENAKIHYINANASETRGYTREEMLNLSVSDVDPDFPIEHWSDHWQDLKEKGSLTFESRHKTKDGHIFPVEINANYFEFDNKSYNLALVRDITERKQKRETLQRSESSLAEAQRIAHIGSWEVDFSTGELLWSDETYRIWEIGKLQFGATVEAFYETVHPEDVEKVANAYNESVANKSLYQIEHRLLFSDGRVKYIAERGEPFCDKNGEIIRFVGTAMDITEQQGVKDTLEFVAQRGWKNSGESFLVVLAQYLSRTLGVDYVIIGKLETPPIQAETLVFYAKGEVLPNIQYSLKDSPCGNVMNGKLCCYSENIQQLFPNDIFFVEMQIESYAGIPLSDTTGNVIGLIAVMDSKPLKDAAFITSILQLVATSVAAELERQRSEQVLLDSHHFLKQIVNTLADPVFVKDRKHRWVLLNQAFCDYIGHPLEELLGKSDYDFFPADQADIFWAKDEVVFFSGEENTNEETFTNSAGFVRTILTKKTCYTDSNGQQFLVGIITDITERKQMEETVRQHEQEFRVLVETSPSPIFRYDANCRRIYINPAVEKMTGKIAAELLNRVPSDGSILSKRNGEELERILRYVLETGRMTESEIECVVADGQTHYFYNRYAPELDANGKTVGVVSVAHDITERKHAENLLFQLEREFRTLVDNLPTVVLRYNSNLEHIYANRTYLQVAGITEAEFLSQSTAETWRCTNISSKEYLAVLAEVVRTGKNSEISLECTIAQGQLCYYEAKIVPEYAFNGQVQSVLVLGFDLSERHRQQIIENNRQRVFEKMAHSENLDVILGQVALYVESSKSGRYCAILLFDETEKNLQLVAAPSFPESYCAKSGSSILEVKHEHCTGWLASASLKQRVVIENIDEHPCYSLCQSFVREIGAKACWAEPILSASNQLLGVVTIYLNQVGAPDENDAVLLLQAGHLSAIAIERKRIEQQMSYQASYDALTGLPNRRMFNNRLRIEIIRTDRSGHELALLFIDLDHFKEVNDTLGHDIGDKLLVEAANRIQQCIRESDTVARLGGDEFVVILSDVGSIPPLERIAEAIIKVMTEPFYFGEYVAYISASVGIAVYPQDADNAVTLMSCADQAMYSAKELGRNNFNFFTQSMQEQAHQRLYLINNLRTAIEKEELEVYYQPIVDVVSGKTVKAEALLRWRHPALGMVSPAVFIPLAEETNLIQEIGSWVFYQAADMAKRWNLLSNANEPQKVSINMSPRQLTKGNGEQIAIDYLQTIVLDSRCVVIEITEGLLLDNSPDIIEKLTRLRTAGIEISLDDFGTGYSAISYLKKFNLDYLKIDRSFVQDLEIDASDQAITEAIVVMAHRLGLKVIAEGVETEGQRALLAAVGCEYIQGYFYSKPLPAEAFLSYVLP